MKRAITFSIYSLIIIFVGLIFYFGLKLNPKYSTQNLIGSKIPSFSTQTLRNSSTNFSQKDIKYGKYSLINIWASWCVPCREEHNILMQLSDNPLIEIIGLNYRDNLINAKKFINKLGNPYSEILTDKDGTISIALGAYGIPVTYIIDKNQIILKQFVGALNDQSLKEIESLLK